MENNWQCRIAPSLGDGFAGTPNEVWGTKDYTNKEDPAVFFGLYGIPDLAAFMQHKGEKMILWAGTDVLHFINGYWLKDGGSVRVSPRPIAKYLSEYKNYVENSIECEELAYYGISAEIVPSFLGDIKKYKVTYKPTNEPKVYTSVSSNNFKTYGWDKVEHLAQMFPEIEFHLYGNTIPWETKNKNVIVHGRVSQLEMDREIMEMQGAVRLLDHDGFSEVAAKAFLRGQYVFSTIKGPYVEEPLKIGSLLGRYDANLEARDYYLKTLNKYPWNKKALN